MAVIWIISPLELEWTIPRRDHSWGLNHIFSHTHMAGVTGQKGMLSPGFLISPSGGASRGPCLNGLSFTFLAFNKTCSFLLKKVLVYKVISKIYWIVHVVGHISVCVCVLPIFGLWEGFALFYQVIMISSQTIYCMYM